MANYWEKRFEAIENAQNQHGREYVGLMSKEYDKAIRNLERDISAWYTRYATENGVSYEEAKRQLNSKELKAFRMDVEEYVKKGKSLDPKWKKQLEQASAKVHVSRLESLKLQVQHQAEVVAGTFSGTFEDYAKNTYSDQYYKSVFEIQKGTGFGFDFMKLDANAVNKVIHKPWTTDGKEFSARVWDNRSKLVSELHSNLTQGLIRGESPQKMISRLKDRMNVSRSSAGRLIMTETAFFSSAATKDVYKGLDVEKYKILATLDSHTSPTCRAMDGKVFDQSEYEVGVTAPPFHVYCRTTTVPYFEDDLDFKSKRASRDQDGEYKLVPSGMTYEDWKSVYVDGKQSPQTWLKHYKIDQLSRVIPKLKDQISQDETELNELGNTTYTGIWKDPVTLSQWAEKTESIPKKEAYYKDAIDAGKDVEKNTDYLNKLKEFNSKGEKLSKQYALLDISKEYLSELEDELSKLKPSKKKIKKVVDAFEDAYSESRKNHPKLFSVNEKKEANKLLIGQLGEIWRNSDAATKRALFDYTSGSGSFNRPLSGFRKPYNDYGSGWEEKYYVGKHGVWINYENRGEAIRKMTAAIDKSESQFDMYLHRGCGTEAIESLLEIKRGTLSGLSNFDAYIGKVGKIDSFVSTSAVQGGGFSNSDVIMRIYAPKGTKMIYAEPFSSFGNGDGLSWDGVTSPKYFGSEFEVIVQRGASYRITGMEKRGGKIYMDLEVRPEKGYDLFQQDPNEWTGSTEQYK